MNLSEPQPQGSPTTQPSQIEEIKDLLQNSKQLSEFNEEVPRLGASNSSLVEQMTSLMTTDTTLCVSDNLTDRLVNPVEIYNVAMSPTSISVAFDTVFQTNVVLKKIFKSKLDAVQKSQAELECEISPKLSHFNIVRTFCQASTDSEYQMLLEFINDAEYFVEKVENCHTPIKNELKLKSYMTDLLNGLQYIHSLGYVHCDLKLANLFCEKPTGEEHEGHVKIGDFGLVQKIDPATGTAQLQEICGTFGFKAPEVKKGAFITEKTDMWSVGIILYQLTVAYMPHHMKGYKYGQGPIPFRDFDWKKRSPQHKDFVEKLLSLDPVQRLSAAEALHHPFLSQSDD